MMSTLKSVEVNLLTLDGGDYTYVDISKPLELDDGFINNCYYKFIKKADDQNMNVQQYVFYHNAILIHSLFTQYEQFNDVITPINIVLPFFKNYDIDNIFTKTQQLYENSTIVQTKI